MAHRNARRLHKLVDSLMDFARIEAGALPVVLEAVDPGPVTAEIAALFRAPVEAAGLRLTLNNTLPPGAALLDRDMWEKMVFHLLSNAFKFTLEGGIALRLGGAEGRIELEVADTGIGIEEDEVGRVFDRFYRSRRAAGRSAEGSGVGLSLVRELARMHGGDVALESRRGLGSRFTVRLPWRRPDPSQTGAAAPTGAPPSLARRARFRDELLRYGLGAAEGADAGARPAGEGIRVLVVERDPDVVRYVARLLQDGCRVASAHSADAAMAAIRLGAPDLVLADSTLPGQDGQGGLELVRRIRADGAARAVPVLVLSARAGEEARLEALEAGADDFLAKPFSGRELIARVRSHVQMARVRRAAFEQETALRRQLAELRHDLATVLDGTRDTVVSLDRVQRVVALNDAAAAAAGLPKERLVGATVRRLIPDLPGSELEAALRGAIEGRDTAPVEYFHRATGRWYEVRCYSAPHGALLFGTDVTGRKLAEQARRQAHAELERRVEERTEALRAANGLLAAVFDRAPGGVALSDREGRIVRANDAYAALVGLDAAMLPERSLDEWIEAADLARLRDGHARLLAGACGSFEIELRYRCPDGRRLWVAHFVSLILPAWRGERCFVTIARDVTARKRSETESETARLELRTLYERLQSVRENERKALAREVHDQLGQILSAAKIDIKLLEDDLRDDSRPMVRPAILGELGSASATLERAIGLVREIATELRAPELDEQGLYAAITWHVHDFERRTRIACHVTFEPSRPHPSRAAAAALLRILQEAMTNVLRHAQASKVWVSLERRGAMLVLRVRDDGVGIARASLRRGVSLGLQGMRERAELVDGKLLAGPLAPRGTLVSARVPLHSTQGSRS
ncbi:ATP-binding protein [Massilia sp. DD77]|uniref:ATP-binding protein n=1 Tax=Massilia sp. DD77 TaxID=3109349 RepID=UPI002FFFECD6